MSTMYSISSDTLTGLADAVRGLTGTSAPLSPDGMIDGIEGHVCPSPTINPLSVTQNGVYTAPSGVDGYSPVTVNVSGGGGASNFELLYETEQSFSITGTSEQLIFTAPSIGNIFSSDFIIYVRIRDKAGRRDGYFFGTDAYFYNINAETGSTAEATGRLIYTFRMNGSTIGQTSSPYGVYAQGITADGNVRIYGRYNATGSRTVNGTYLIKVYKLTLPNGMTPYGN